MEWNVWFAIFIRWLEVQDCVTAYQGSVEKMRLDSSRKAWHERLLADVYKFRIF